MNEFVTNGLGGILMLLIILPFMVYLLVAKDIPNWHRWAFRATCGVATIGMLYHVVRLWY